MKHSNFFEKETIQDNDVWFDQENTGPGTRSQKGLYASFGKRLFDIGISLALMPIVIPLIAIFYLLTRRDGGPGFFAQERIGRNGRVFKCWKIRTMLVDAEGVLTRMCKEDPELAAEWHENQKLQNDPRITRIGHILRKTSMDELPQLWNVLIGEMSLVGPRPMLPSQQSLYLSGGDGQSYFSLRPGITGAWQLDGRGTTSFLSRVRFDNFYHAELSIWKDVVYLVRTLVVPFRRTGA